MLRRFFTVHLLLIDMSQESAVRIFDFFQILTKKTTKNYVLFASD